MVGRVGIEPTTGRLKAECSTSELTPPQISGYAGQDTGRDDTKNGRNDKGLGYRASGGAPTSNLTRVSRVGTRSNGSPASGPLRPFVSGAARPASPRWYPSNRPVPGSVLSARHSSVPVRSCNIRSSTTHRAPCGNPDID